MHPSFMFVLFYYAEFTDSVVMDPQNCLINYLLPLLLKVTASYTTKDPRKQVTNTSAVNFIILLFPRLLQDFDSYIKQFSNFKLKKTLPSCSNQGQIINQHILRVCFAGHSWIFHIMRQMYIKLCKMCSHSMKTLYCKIVFI